MISSLSSQAAIFFFFPLGHGRGRGWCRVLLARIRRRFERVGLPQQARRGRGGVRRHVQPGRGRARVRGLVFSLVAAGRGGWSRGRGGRGEKTCLGYVGVGVLESDIYILKILDPFSYMFFLRFTLH